MKCEIFIDYSHESGWRLIMVNNSIPSGYVIRGISADEAENLNLRMTNEATEQAAYAARKTAELKAYYANKNAVAV